MRRMNAAVLGLASVLALGLAPALAMFCGGVASGGGGGGGALPCNLYVAATGGNDSNPGTAGSPFATLGKLQTSLRAASAGSKVGCLKAGTYSLGAAVVLNTSDNGEVWQFDPASGVNTAVLDGGSSTVEAFRIVTAGANGITFNGIKLQNFTTFGIEYYGATTSGTIENMEVVNTTSTSGTTGAISIGGNILVSNNYCHDQNAQCIMSFAFNSGDSNAGTVIQNNVVIKACLAFADCGGIYLDAAGSHCCSSNGIVIQGNYVRDGGAAGAGGYNDFYLDDFTSGVTVTGNIFAAPTQTSASGVGCGVRSGGCIHDGSNNVITGNLFDLGAGGNVNGIIFAVEGGVAQTGNRVSGNIFVSGYVGGGTFGYGGQNSLSSYTIANNDYVNYAGGTVRSDGQGVGGGATGDASPQTPTTVQLALTCPGAVFTLAGGSIAFSSPVNFPGIPSPSALGPPGLAIPSSTNHSC